MSLLRKKMTVKVNNQVIRKNEDASYRRAVLETHASCCKDHILLTGTVLYRVRLAIGRDSGSPQLL